MGKKWNLEHWNNKTRNGKEMRKCYIK
jgi:hypothetical protein